jgi:hypothetical protein
MNLISFPNSVSCYIWGSSTFGSHKHVELVANTYWAWKALVLHDCMTGSSLGNIPSPFQARADFPQCFALEVLSLCQAGHLKNVRVLKCNLQLAGEVSKGQEIGAADLGCGRGRLEYVCMYWEADEILWSRKASGIANHM